MKIKTRKTIAKRIKRTKSGVLMRAVIGNQHLRHRKSARSLRASKAGTVKLSPRDIKELGL